MKLQNIPEIAFVSSHPENVQMHEDQNQEHALPEKRSQTWRSEQDKNYKILFYHFKGKTVSGPKSHDPNMVRVVLQRHSCNT